MRNPKSKGLPPQALPPSFRACATVADVLQVLAEGKRQARVWRKRGNTGAVKDILHALEYDLGQLQNHPAFRGMQLPKTIYDDVDLGFTEAFAALRAHDGTTQLSFENLGMPPSKCPSCVHGDHEACETAGPFGDPRDGDLICTCSCPRATGMDVLTRAAHAAFKAAAPTPITPVAPPAFVGPPRRRSMNVDCEVEETTLERDDGREQLGVRVTCSRCSHTVESFGIESPSLRRCAALLREQCPRRERNFYVVEES